MFRLHKVFVAADRVLLFVVGVGQCVRRLWLHKGQLIVRQLPVELLASARHAAPSRFANYAVNLPVVSGGATYIFKAANVLGLVSHKDGVVNVKVQHEAAVAILSGHYNNYNSTQIHFHARMPVRYC